MERKKSKHNVIFPKVLDMNRFLQVSQDEGAARSLTLPKEENIYELRGILVHKGPSAYHGHYKAMVFDVE